MVKPDLGIKRVCPSCAARFYDLQKRPIECPKCEFTFEPESLLRQRRPRVPEPVQKAEPAEAAEEEESEDAEGEEAEDETVDEVEEEVVEVVEDAPLEPTDDEEAEVENTGISVKEGDAEEEEDDFPEEEIDDDDDDLLEEVEEDEDDVAGIIDADIEKEEP